MRSYTVTILGALLSLSLLANVFFLSHHVNNQSYLSGILTDWFPAIDLHTQQQATSNSSKKMLSEATNRQVTDKPSQTPLELTNALFEQQLYSQAIDVYQTLNLTQKNTVKEHWLNQLTRLLQQEQADLVLTFCLTFLQQSPDDQAIKKILAKAYIATGDLPYGLELYYQLSRQSTPSEEDSLLEVIHQHALAQIKRLSDSSSWDELSSFVTPLINYETDYPPYLFALAQANFQLSSYDEALTALISITTDPVYGQQATLLEDKILSALSKLEGISLVSYGTHFITSGMINDEHSIELMIDTGASLSVLSQERFEQLAIESGIELIGERQIATAGGIVTAPVYRFDSLSINNYEVTDIEFVILELQSLQGSEGLLGMNYLQNYKFEIDQEQKLLLLKKRL